MILSNPPYIAAQDPHLTQSGIRFEPRAHWSPDPTACPLCELSPVTQCGIYAMAEFCY